MTPQIVESFGKTRPWVLFLSILGFISAGFMFLAALVVPVTLCVQGKAGSIVLGIGLFALYSFFACICYLIPAVLLSRFASRIRDLSAAPNDIGALEAVVAAQKSFWRYVGILALVGLCIGLLCLVIGVIAGVVVGVRH